MSYLAKLFKAPARNGALFTSPTPAVWSRHNFKFTKAPVQRRSTYRSSPSCRNYERITLRPSIQRSTTRGFSTSQGSRARRISDFILKASLAGSVLYMSWLVVDLALLYWHNVNPPILSDLPGEVREYLVVVRGAIHFGLEDQILENLEGAWEAIRSVPVEVLYQIPSVKMLSVAIWYSDYLEKAGRACIAYKVLCEAVDMYQTHLQELPSSSSITYTETHRPVNIEKTYLISMLARLAGLAEMCEPTAEGKWLSHALLDMIPLLPPDQEFQQRVHDKMTRVESFATTDPCFSGFSLQLDSRFRLPSGSAESGRIEDCPTPENVNLEDDIILEDEYFFLPFWCPTDPSYACSLVFERLGVFAGKHGDWWMSKDAHVLALGSLHKQSSPPATNHDDGLLELESLSRKLRIGNHIMEAHLQLLEEMTIPEIWMTILSSALNINSVSRALVVEGLRFIVKNIAKKSHTRKGVDRFDIFWAESALAWKDAAIIYEKTGGADVALQMYQGALIYLELSTHVAKHREMRDIQKRIETLERNIAEGKTSREGQMDAMLAKAAQERAGKESQDKSSGDASATAPT